MKNPEVNINEIIGAFLSEKFDSLISSMTTLAIGAKDNISIALKTKYKDYLGRLIERYGKTRSFFIRDEARDLYSFYVPVGVKSTTKTVPTANLSEIVSVNRFSIISGTGGAGKSILLRHLLYNSLLTKYKVPVFIELRELNLDNNDIHDQIKKSLSVFGLELSDEYFEKSLSAGHYIIFLDGFDELKSDLRDTVIRDLEYFSNKFNLCDVIMTSRPDDKMSGLSLFTTFSILPLDLEKSISLVEKLPAVEEVKKKFTNDLKEGLFEKHKSFLSNPLLLSIMLLTYGYNADIPSKLSIFYNQAYEALFQRHDALKGAYSRDKHVSLDIQDFQKVLAAFCIQTYDDRRFQLSKNEAIEYLRKCERITTIKVDAEKFYNDLLQSVCLLVQDGLFITFTHRSFQEYFAACFVVSCSDSVKKKLVEKYRRNITSDTVIKLAYEMDKDYFDSEIILPFIKNLLKKAKITRPTTQAYLSFIQTIWKRFHVSRGTLGASPKIGGDSSVVSFILFETKIINHKEVYVRSNGVISIGKYLEQKMETSRKNHTEEIFETSKMKITDEFFLNLKDGAHFFSIHTLEGLIKVKDKIIAAQKNKKNTLTEILFNSKETTNKKGAGL